MARSRPRTTGAKALFPALAAALAAAVALFSAGGTETAVANGDTRTITLHHAHTQESITATFLVDGRYDAAVLERLNWFLRDWRRNEATHMDPRLFDVIWEVYRESGSQLPVDVMSAYRSPETNAMLRRRSRGVAEHSQHILGKAMDQHYVDVPMSRIRDIAMKLQRGGVGFYPTAGTPFVHMDVGGVRHWPRMSYDQLARLFPDGKTVHIPSNGQPLPGYEEARAELAARGDGFEYPTVTEVKSKGFFAWLFGGGDEETDVAAVQDTGRGRTRAASFDRSAGGAPVQLAGSPMGKDAGVRGFFASNSAPAAQPPAPAPQPAAVALAEPTPEPPSAPQERQVLARAMADERSRQAATASPPLTQAPAPLATPLALATSATPASNATVAAFAPLPPRRPVELASAGPQTPLPPSRPTEMASLTPNAQGAKADAVGRLIGRLPSGRAADLPTAITGSGGPSARAPGAIAPVLAYAAQGASPPPLARSFVPFPVARPAFVAARLDRSNFRNLTGSSTTVRTSARNLGSAVAALRPSAAASLGTMTAHVADGQTQSFSTRATDLPIDRFAGSAVKPLERVVTSSVSPSGRLRTTTE